MNILRDQLYKLPKADVHNHLHLGGNIEVLKQNYPQSSINIPEYYDGLEGMIDFIQNKINRIMRTSEDVKYFMELALKSAIDDKVEYLEASVDISLVRYFDGSIHKLMDLIHELKTKYSTQLDFKPDVGINKDCDMEKVYSDGIACVDSGLFSGIDIYGKEYNKKLDGFVDIYKNARQKQLKTKVHIGEFSDHKSIEETINLLQPNEIQHGIMAAESEQTMDMILNNNIQLNICTQSNIALGTVKNISEHPIRKLFDHGIKITLNTDDLLLFDASITDQYLDLIENDIFSLDEIDSIRKNGFS